jgi:N-acetylglucosamine malate deacetylase 1
MNKMSQHHVVIISAHPDDMEIGMGGTAAKLAESMAVITSVVITNGGRSSNPFTLTEQRLAELRREEALRAAAVLGVQEVVFYDEPDAADEIDATSVTRRLVEILVRLQPTEVYTLDEELDRHPAHRLAGKLARESVLKAGIVLNGGIWAYEIWGPFATWDRLEYIDRYVAKKMAAIAEHHSQVATIPYGEGVLGLNRWRAVFAHPKASAPAGQYAEAFRRIAIAPVLK